MVTEFELKNITFLCLKYIPLNFYKIQMHCGGKNSIVV